MTSELILYFRNMANGPQTFGKPSVTWSFFTTFLGNTYMVFLCIYIYTNYIYIYTYLSIFLYVLFIYIFAHICKNVHVYVIHSQSWTCSFQIYLLVSQWYMRTHNPNQAAWGCDVDEYWIVVSDLEHVFIKAFYIICLYWIFPFC